MSSVEDAAHWFLIFAAFDHNHFILGYISPFEVFGEKFAGSVVGGIVDDDHSVVAVILLEDGLDIPDVAIKGLVVVAGRDDTHCDLFFVFVYLVFLFEITFLT